MRNLLLALWFMALLLTPGRVIGSTVLNVNTSLETDNLAPYNVPDAWIPIKDTMLNGSGMSTAQVHSGSYSFAIESDGDFDQEGLYQPCSVSACHGSANDVITVSGYSYADDAGIGSGDNVLYELFVWIIWNDDSAHSSGVNFDKLASGWQYKTVSLTAGQDYKALRIGVYFSSYGGQGLGPVYFDDLVLSR